MEAAVKLDRAALAAEMDENQKEIRKMVMDSYQDMLAGKGRDYKEFFAELESRYRNTNV